MIRKILMGILTVLLAVLLYFTIANGVSIGSFKAYGIKNIKQENENIENKISSASKLTSVEYPSKLSELNKNAKTLLSKKEEYSDLTTYSTAEQVQAANELEDFEVEYLWATVGNYATKEGIKIKMDISSATNGATSADGRKMYDLNFTAEGSYIGIALFLADIQDDSFLEFKVENFNMTAGTDTNTLKATFIVKDIPIKIDTLSAEVSQENTENNDNKNETNNNSTNTTNSSNTNSNTNTNTNTNSNTNNTTK